MVSHFRAQRGQLIGVRAQSISRGEPSFLSVEFQWSDLRFSVPLYGVGDRLPCPLGGPFWVTEEGSLQSGVYFNWRPVARIILEAGRQDNYAKLGKQKSLIGVGVSMSSLTCGGGETRVSGCFRRNDSQRAACGEIRGQTLAERWWDRTGGEAFGFAQDDRVIGIREAGPQPRRRPTNCRQRKGGWL
jgi:hypothetical protein